MSANPVADQLRVMAELYRDPLLSPSVEALRAQFAGVAEGLSAQLAVAARQPDPARLEGLAVSLDAARRLANELAHALQQVEESDSEN